MEILAVLQSSETKPTTAAQGSLSLLPTISTLTMTIGGVVTTGAIIIGFVHHYYYYSRRNSDISLNCVDSTQSREDIVHQPLHEELPPPCSKDLLHPVVVNFLEKLWCNQDWDNAHPKYSEKKDMEMLFAPVPWAKTKAVKLTWTIPAPATLSAVEKVFTEVKYSLQVDPLMESKEILRVLEPAAAAVPSSFSSSSLLKRESESSSGRPEVVLTHVKFKSPIWGVSARDMVQRWVRSYSLDSLEKRKKYYLPNSDRPDLKVWLCVGEAANDEVPEEDGYTRATGHLFGVIAWEKGDGSIGIVFSFSLELEGSFPATLVDAPYFLQFERMKQMSALILRESKKHQQKDGGDDSFLEGEEGRVTATGTSDCSDQYSPSSSSPSLLPLDVVHRLPPTNSGFRTFQASDLDSQEAKKQMYEFFESEGYLVLDGVLTPEETCVAKDKFSHLMKHALGLDMENPSVEAFNTVFADSERGIASHSGTGHSAMNWYIRSKKRVQQAFALTNNLLYGSDKLITSFDGINYFRNPEIEPSWTPTKKSWLHFDATCFEHANYVQGIVNLIDCTNENDAGLVVFPRTHRLVFPVLVAAVEDADDDDSSVRKGDGDNDPRSFYLLMEAGKWKKVRSSPVVMEALGETRAFRVPLKAGSLVMWSSSLMHCNMGPLPRGEGAGRDQNQWLRRLVSYICMMKDPENPELSSQRLEHFRKGQTTCHTPDILRGLRDPANKDLVEAGAVILDSEDLPEGAECLL